MHIGDLDGTSAKEKKNIWQASITILVVDANGAPVPEATIALSSWADGDDYWGTDPCVTDGAGLCSYGFDSVRTSVQSITFTVDDIAHATLTYEPGSNGDPDGDSDGTTITVNQP
jgi:hypothetical protein